MIVPCAQVRSSGLLTTHVSRHSDTEEVQSRAATRREHGHKVRSCIAICAPDVQAILSALGISRIAVWAFSGGGPYALATAALLPDAVAAICVLASLGPYGAPGLP